MACVMASETERRTAVNNIAAATAMIPRIRRATTVAMEKRGVMADGTVTEIEQRPADIMGTVDMGTVDTAIAATGTAAGMTPLCRLDIRIAGLMAARSGPPAAASVRRYSRPTIT